MGRAFWFEIQVCNIKEASEDTKSIKYQEVPFTDTLEFLIELKLGEIQMGENEERRGVGIVC